MCHRRIAMLVFSCATWLAISGDVLAHAPVATIELGRKIFFDQSLSADSTKSCASCHELSHAFAENRHTSIGVFNRLGVRNAPSLLGVSELASFFWDGRRETLHAAVTDPFFTPFEMGLNNSQELISRLRRAGYDRLFKSVFGTTRALDEDEVRSSLEAYIRSLDASPVQARASTESFAQSVVRGKKVFQGSGQCATCHMAYGEHALTDSSFHPSALGTLKIAGKLPELAQEAVKLDSAPRAIATAIGKNPDLGELGRFLVTKNPSDINAFRTPSLLHVASTAPYMHNGSVQSLSEAVELEIYYRGLTSGRLIALTAQQKADLLAYLQSLN